MRNTAKTKAIYHTTLADVKEHLNMEADYLTDDNYLTGVIKRATALAEAYLDADIAKTTNVLNIYDYLGTLVDIIDMPWISLESVTYLDSDAASQTVTLADIEIRIGTQKVELTLPDSLDTDKLTVSFTTGYATLDTVPVGIQDAILTKCADLNDVQRGSILLTSFKDFGTFETALNYYKRISY